MRKKSFNILVILCFAFVATGLMHDSKDITIPIDSDEALEFDNKGSEDLTNFLVETKHINFNHPIFSDALKQIVTPDMNLEQKLEKLYYFTRDTIPFDPSTTALTASGALKEMKAICYTKAMIYVSFCRRLASNTNNRAAVLYQILLHHI
jgi:transglutaminase-like putative cysteine protease